MQFASGVYQSRFWGLKGRAELLFIFFLSWFLALLFFFPSRNQYVKTDESNSSSIIFAELTSEKEKSLEESGIENQNNRLVNYTTNAVTRDASEFESSSLVQGNGLADLPSRSIVEHQLPLRHHSDLEENFTSTEESSENLSLLGQTEVGNFPRTYRRFDAHP